MTKVAPPAYLSSYPLFPLSTLGPYRRADYARLPDEPRCELLYGHLYLPPKNTVVHQTALGVLATHFELFVEEPARSTFFVGPLDVFLFEHTVLQPDLLFLSSARFDGLTDAGVEGPPDLVVEVLGPGSARRDRSLKLLAYAEAGVSEYWLVDPEIAHIDFLVHAGDGFRIVLPGDGIYTSPAFPALQLPLERFWATFFRRLPEHLRAPLESDRLRTSLSDVQSSPPSERSAE